MAERDIAESDEGGATVFNPPSLQALSSFGALWAFFSVDFDQIVLF